MLEKFKRKGWKASFTVEAAFLMPVTILLLAWILSLSMDLYTQVDQKASDLKQAEKQDSLQQFRSLEIAGEILDMVRNRKK